MRIGRLLIVSAVCSACVLLGAAGGVIAQVVQNNVLDITVAKHVDMATDGNAAARYAGGTALLQANNEVCDDVACCVILNKAGPSGAFGVVGDGLDVITSEAELDTVFAVATHHTKVVTSASDCCGVTGPILGCAKTTSRNIVMVETAPDDVWAHEFGHTQGLAHNDTCAQLIMHSSNPDTNAVTQAECDTFRANPDRIGDTWIVWSLTTTVKVTDQSGLDCSACPGQTITRSDSPSYTLPGTRILLNTLVDSILNPGDLTIYTCDPRGAPPGQWCNDRTEGSARSSLRPFRWTVRHSLDALAMGRNHGKAFANTTARGVGKVVWPNHNPGDPVPGTLTLKLRAFGSLNAVCDFDHLASADMDVSLDLTPFSRPGGGLPPAIPAQSMTWAVMCDQLNQGPFTLDMTMGPGLQVGDRYSYTFSLTHNAAANSFSTPGSGQADASFGNTVELTPESSADPSISFDFDVPDDAAVPALSLWGFFALVTLLLGGGTYLLAARLKQKKASA